MVYCLVRRFTKAMAMIPHKDRILSGMNTIMNSLPKTIGRVSEAYVSDIKRHSNIYFVCMHRYVPELYEPYSVVLNSSKTHIFGAIQETIYSKFDRTLKDYIQTINKPTNLSVKVTGPNDQAHYDKLKENYYIEKNFYPMLNTVVYDRDIRQEKHRFSLTLIDTEMVRNFIKDDEHIHIIGSTPTIANKKILDIAFDNEDYIMYLIPYIENHFLTQLIYYR